MLNMWHVLWWHAYLCCVTCLSNVQILFDSLPVQILNVCCSAVSVVQLPSYIHLHLPGHLTMPRSEFPSKLQGYIFRYFTILYRTQMIIFWEACFLRNYSRTTSRPRSRSPLRWEWRWCWKSVEIGGTQIWHLIFLVSVLDVRLFYKECFMWKSNTSRYWVWWRQPV